MKKKVNKILSYSVIVNIFLVIFKISVGFIGKSKAMIADGVNSFSDLTTDVIAIFGNKMSDKPSDAKHPFGYGQIEYLTSIIVGLFIMLMGINLIVQAFNTNVMVPTVLVLIISIVVFIVKYSFSRYMLRVGYKIKNSILITSGIESRADAITSLFVIISFILSRLGSYNAIYFYSDNICTFIIGVYIIIISFKILKENFVNIIGVNEEDSEYIEKIKKKILSNDNVLSVESINLLKYGSYYSADIEIVLNKNMKLKDINKVISVLKQQLCNKRTKIGYIKISVIPD